MANYEAFAPTLTADMNTRPADFSVVGIVRRSPRGGT